MSLHFGAEGSLGILLYVGAIAAILGSIFWRPVLGIFYLAPLIPLPDRALSPQRVSAGRQRGNNCSSSCCHRRDADKAAALS